MLNTIIIPAHTRTVFFLYHGGYDRKLKKYKLNLPELNFKRTPSGDVRLRIGNDRTRYVPPFSNISPVTHHICFGDAVQNHNHIESLPLKTLVDLFFKTPFTSTFTEFLDYYIPDLQDLFNEYRPLAHDAIDKLYTNWQNKGKLELIPFFSRFDI